MCDQRLAENAQLQNVHDVGLLLCKVTCIDFANVKKIKGDSEQILHEFLKKMYSKVTFWPYRWLIVTFRALNVHVLYVPLLLIEMGSSCRNFVILYIRFNIYFLMVLYQTTVTTCTCTSHVCEAIPLCTPFKSCKPSSKELNDTR